MLWIERKIVKYRNVESNRECVHHVLIARAGGKNILLSHANLFLHAHALASIETSARYSTVIAMFYRFLSSQKKFLQVDVENYHVLADNGDIKRWQIARQIDRVKQQKTSPNSGTIFEDAKIVLFFFSWIQDEGYTSNVRVKKVTWCPNFKAQRMLNYVQAKARTKIDSKNIEALDKDRRQLKAASLISQLEIVELIQSYIDPVYATLFKLSLGTAMRPMDLCKFPYIGNGKNKHIMPYSSMRKNDDQTIDFHVIESKGRKDRTIKINVADMRMVEDAYIRPYYADRAAKFEKKFGKKCPPSLLFLNKDGTPITSLMISSRTYDAKKIAMKNCSEFRGSIKFYDARHWWPTMFLINFFKERLLSDAADALYLAAAQVLLNQMGHSELSTTFKYYVDMARLVLIAHEGSVHELITKPTETVEQFVHKIHSSSLI